MDRIRHQLPPLPMSTQAVVNEDSYSKQVQMTSVVVNNSNKRNSAYNNSGSLQQRTNIRSGLEQQQEETSNNHSSNETSPAIATPTFPEKRDDPVSNSQQLIGNKHNIKKNTLVDRTNGNRCCHEKPAKRRRQPIHEHEQHQEEKMQQQQYQQMALSFLIGAPPPSGRQVASTLAQARELIHLYTKSANAAHANELSSQLLNLTGYDLTPPLDALPTTSTSTTALHKQQSFRALAPSLQRLEQLKTDTSRAMQTMTRAKVVQQKQQHKSYRDCSTKQKVSGMEYEERYYAVMDAIREVRGQKWRVYWNELENERGVPKATTSIQQAEVIEQEPQENRATAPVASFKAVVEQKPERVVVVLSSPETKHPTTILGVPITARTVTNCDEEGKRDSKPAAAQEVSTTCVEEATEMAPPTTTTDGNSNVDSTAALPKVNASTPVLSKTSYLPADRNMLPPDLLKATNTATDGDWNTPERLQLERAETKLWSTIDTALDQYSQQVLVLRAKAAVRKHPCPRWDQQCSSSRSEP